MKISRPVDSSITRTLMNILTNSLLFENISYRENYVNSDITLAETSDHFLQTARLAIMDRIDEILLASTTVKFDTRRDAQYYYYQPSRVSYQKYGVTDYWWIIMLMNGYDSIHDFKDFEYLWVPNEETVKKIVMEIEFKEKQQ